MKKVFSFILAVLVFLSAASLAQAEAGNGTDMEAQAMPLLIQLPGMDTEAGIREYLTGEWHFYDSAFPGYKSCRMVIDEDLNVELAIYSGLQGELRGEYSGRFSFDRVYADTHEAPDLLCLGLADSALLGGDFFFLHRTVVDGCRIMSLFSAGNGGCIFDFLDSSVEDEWGNCPVEIRFYQETGEEYQLAPQRNAEFYAVFWGYGKAEEGFCLDDIHWPPPGPYDFEQIGSNAWYRYLTTRYDNEKPVSVAYDIAKDMTLENDGELCDGDVYLVKTNEQGEIIHMQLVRED